MEPAETPRRRNWIVEALVHVRRRRDLTLGLVVLTLGTAALCWIGMWEVPWYGRIPVVVVAVVVLDGMTLGMIHDYTDPDERDSAEWLAEQARERRDRAIPPE